MPKILVARKIPSSVLEKLNAVGEVDLYAGEDPMTPEELRARVKGKTALVSMLTEQVDKTLIDGSPDLKIVANVAVGYNNIDIAYARSKGVIVTHTPDVLTEAVADFTWAIILDITRRISEGDRLVRRGVWKGWAFDFMLGSELRGKQLGLIGLGRIGAAVAAKAPAFGMRVAYHTVPPVDLPGAEAMSFDRVLNTSDIVSLHLIDRKALARMKRSAYLINTARGPVIDEEALAWALKERLISGAALDVYEHEPKVHSELMTLENVLLAPHLASGTTETRTAMAELAVSNVIAVLNGRDPITPVPN
jgi:glyoxylate reductase